MDLCGPQNPAHGVLKFPGTSSWLVGARGHEWLGDLWSSSRCVSARHLGQNIPLGSVVGSWIMLTLARFGLPIQDSCSAQLTTGGCLLACSPEADFPNALGKFLDPVHLCCQHTGCARRRHLGYKVVLMIYMVCWCAWRRLLGKAMLYLYRVCLVKAPGLQSPSE